MAEEHETDGREARAEARRRRAAEQQARALAALDAIRSGSDVTQESLNLANEYTDRHTSAMSAWFRRLFRRG